MESVTILRDLWRRRIAVGAVAVVAIAIAFLLAYSPTLPPERRSYDVGIATASVLVDTPRSQVVEVEPKGSETLANRANVLANLMVDGEIKDAIVGRAGLPASKVVASAQSPGSSDPPPPLQAGSYALMTSVALTSDMAELPIIRIQTQAPDVSQAIKLANAAVEGLSEYLDTKAADESIVDSRRLRVRALGTAQGHAAARGPSRMVALAVGFVAFLAGCAVLLIISAIVRGWRAAVAIEEDFAGEGDLGAAAGVDETDPFDGAEWPTRPEEPTKLRAS